MLFEQYNMMNNIDGLASNNVVVVVVSNLSMQPYNSGVVKAFVQLQPSIAVATSCEQGGC